MSNGAKTDSLLNSVIKTVNENYSKIKWMPLNSNPYVNEMIVDNNEVALPSGFSYQWPGPISMIDIGIFWDTDQIRGEYYRNVLELMASKIPWSINAIKGYQDLSKYGLIIQNNNNWPEELLRQIGDTMAGESTIQDGYVYALGHNVEDHIHEVLSIFAEIIKTPS